MQAIQAKLIKVTDFIKKITAVGSDDPILVITIAPLVLADVASHPGKFFCSKIPPSYLQLAI